MKIIFKTATLGFYGEFGETPAAKAICAKLPFDFAAAYRSNDIFLKLPMESLCGVATTSANAGDIAYLPNEQGIIIFTEKPQPAAPVNTIIIGHTAAAIDELKTIKPQEKISVSLDKVKTAPTYDTRILSQSEIDALIKQMAAAKKTT